MRRKAKVHSDFETFFIVGELGLDGSIVYMAYDGCGDFGETYDAVKAEKFSCSVKEAKSFLKEDKDAIKWVKNHPNAKIYQIKLGYIVDLTPKGVAPIVKDKEDNE